MSKIYKQLARCSLCKQMYVVEKDSKTFSRYYCPACFKKHDMGKRKY